MKSYTYMAVTVLAGLQAFTYAGVTAEINGSEEFKSNRYGEYTIAFERIPDKKPVKALKDSYSWESEGRVNLDPRDSLCYVIAGKRSTSSTRKGAISCKGDHQGETYTAKPFDFIILPVLEGFEHNPPPAK